MRMFSGSGAAALLAASFATAAEAKALWPDEFRIYSENDFFNPFTERTDRFYTQGLRFEWFYSGKRANPSFLPGVDHAEWCRLLCGSTSDPKIVSSGWAFGQNMYTPRVITIAAPQPEDRPWAGLLYGSRIARVRYKDETLKAQRQDSIEVTVGIVGPASFAKQTQIAWHDLINDDRPEGWDNQLRNEPVVQLRYESAFRWPKDDGGPADVITRMRGNLGNALTSLETEAIARVGWNLSGLGVNAIPGTGLLSTGTRRGPSGNLFLRAGLKAVAHNIFLDGNTFADNDIRIERKPFVPEIAAGIELNVIPHVGLSYQFVRRGSEFESRNGNDAPKQDFGALTLTIRADRWEP